MWCIGNLFYILSGAPATQKRIGEKVHNFIRNFEKDFKLKEAVPQIFQIKYLRQALFLAKIYVESTENQQTSNMIDLSDFIGNSDIYAMKEIFFKLLETKDNLEKDLERTPK